MSHCELHQPALSSDPPAPGVKRASSASPAASSEARCSGDPHQGTAAVSRVRWLCKGSAGSARAPLIQSHSTTEDND